MGVKFRRNQALYRRTMMAFIRANSLPFENGGKACPSNPQIIRAFLGLIDLSSYGRKEKLQACYEYCLSKGFTAPKKAKRNTANYNGNVNSDDFLSSYAWRNARYEAIKKNNGRCECCGASPKENNIVLHVDHIKSRRLFPELALDPSNFQVLCEDCNHGKGFLDQTDWRKDQTIN